MAKKSVQNLSRRERQIMDILFREGEATVERVRKGLPDPPSYSAVRALLGVLENKGFVGHHKEGRAYTYVPTMNLDAVRDSALKHLVQTLFDGSIEDVVATLMSMSDTELSDRDFERLARLIRKKRKEQSGK
jgi:BlaI family penicillinase repressor